MYIPYLPGIFWCLFSVECVILFVEIDMSEMSDYISVEKNKKLLSCHLPFCEEENEKKNEE